MGKNRLLLLGAISITSLFPKTTIDYDRAISFAKYHTYAWVGVNTQDSVSDDQVRNAIDRQLTARGWRKADSGGDARIVAFGSSRTLREVLGWYRDVLLANGQLITAPPEVELKTLGTLHINIFDSQSKKVIWRAQCTETLTGNPKKNEKKLEEAVANAFRKFPPA